MNNKKRKAEVIPALQSPHRPMAVRQQQVEQVVEVPVPIIQDPQKRIPQTVVEVMVEEPVPMIQEEIEHPPQNIQHDFHWTKQPAQRVADVPFDVTTSAYGQHFYYEDELLNAVETMSGMPAPSITRRRHYFYSL